MDSPRASIAMSSRTLALAVDSIRQYCILLDQ